MTKVVINACYGGFSLSTEALQWLSHRSGRLWESKCKWGRYDGERHNALLVAAVEELGARAGGRYAELEVVDIGDEDRYRVCEYDGMEWVETPNTIDDWVHV